MDSYCCRTQITTMNNLFQMKYYMLSIKLSIEFTQHTHIAKAYANLLKGNLDGLKKRDKKTAKAAAAKAKKLKATT